MLETCINLLERFCFNCHTNRDYKNECDGCPTGNLFNNCRDYFNVEFDDTMQMIYKELTKIQLGAFCYIGGTAYDFGNDYDENYKDIIKNLKHLLLKIKIDKIQEL